VLYCLSVDIERPRYCVECIQISRRPFLAAVWSPMIKYADHLGQIALPSTSNFSLAARRATFQAHEWFHSIESPILRLLLMRFNYKASSEPQHQIIRKDLLARMFVLNLRSKVVDPLSQTSRSSSPKASTNHDRRRSENFDRRYARLNKEW
jgi:hypothetical protein